MVQVLPDAVTAADCRRRVETVMCGDDGNRVADVLARPVGESPKTPARAKRRLRPPPVGDDAHRGRLSFPRTHAARTHGHPLPPPRNSLPPPMPQAPNTAPHPSTHNHQQAADSPSSRSPIVRKRLLYDLDDIIIILTGRIHRHVEIDIEAPRVAEFPNSRSDFFQTQIRGDKALPLPSLAITLTALTFPHTHSRFSRSIETLLP
ncbi:hypothetical protein QTP88_007262 [Uroleucon formosanum]